MRAIIAVVLLVAGHRNLFQYVEQPPKKAAVAKHAAQLVIVPPPEERQASSHAVIETPQPPAFPYRCIGRFGLDANPFAVFDAGGAIINVRIGDVIDGKFIVRAIGLESVTIGVDGFPGKDQRVSIGPRQE